MEMNLGFFGVQFSFGLQQANMGPIYGMLGAAEAAIPLLWLAGPVTGLLVQPLIGAMSDRTTGPLGRRTPYFLIGAIICSVSLLLMPNSSSLWMAASLLWLLDAGNNITLEPYRAYVADRLGAGQQAAGYLTQSAFTGLAQSMAYVAPSVLATIVDRNLLGSNGIPVIVRLAFILGALFSLSSVLWSVLRVPELPMNDAEKGTVASRGTRIAGALGDIVCAIRDMPLPMRQMMPAMLCQWYAMFIYWQFISFALARSLHGTSDPLSEGFRDATLAAQQVGAIYNLIAFMGAIALIPLVGRFGPRSVHAICLSLAGMAILLIPLVQDKWLLLLLAIGIGIGWASMMGNCHAILAEAIPVGKNGIYMGIFNMFIVIPMLIETVTMPLLYDPLLGGDPRNALAMAGILLVAGGILTLFVSAGGRAGCISSVQRP